MVLFEAGRHPGANGIKFQDGLTSISVSGRRLMLQTTLQPDGLRPGPVEPALTRVLGDDFAFGASASLYIAAHAAQPEFATVVGPKEGAVEATACASDARPSTSMRATSQRMAVS
jgi:hypothetical protein